MPENNIPSWFNPTEYANFLAESSILFEPISQQESSSMFNHKKLEIHNKFISALYEEAVSNKTPIKAEKHRMRPQVDPSDSDRDRKRESRHQDGQTDILSSLLIVKNVNSNKIEIILKTDFDRKIHTIIKGKLGKIDKGDVNKRDLNHYSSMENFLNTKTSIKLLGRVEGKDEETNKKQKGESSPAEHAEQQENIPTPAPQIRTPKDGKEITNAFSTYADWDHSAEQIGAVLPDALNTLTGAQPSVEYQQTIDSSRTLGSSLQRIVNELQKEFPETANMTYALADPMYPTGKLWASMGVSSAASNATLIGTAKDTSMGVSVKIGEQIRPVNKGEAGLILNTIMSTIDPNDASIVFSAFIEDFIQELKDDYSQSPMFNPVINNMIASPTTKKGSDLILKKKEQAETISIRKNNFIQKVGDLVEMYVNEYLPVKEAFLLEALSGNIKFEGGLGSAQVMLSSYKDGTEAKLISLTPEFMEDFADSDDTDLNFKFRATPNSSGGFFQNILLKMAQLNEGALDLVSDISNLKAQLISPQIFLQYFELELIDAVFVAPLIYSNFYSGDSDGVNTVTILSGRDQPEQLSIPVRTNFDPDGVPEDVIEKGTDALLESYLLANDYFVSGVNSGEISYADAVDNLNEQFTLFESKKKKRNYRREYDNYQGKPEQRANRSKRVLARRKMVKKGKVHKGDGKDVNHIDGNPQNNSMSNLEPMSAHENRSIHEDHGAGFAGTPEYVSKLSSDTPYSVNPAKSCTDCKTYSEIRKKKKK